MDDRIRAVVFGVGTMNTIATRMLLEKDVEIVGALARSDAKVGQDLGTVVGLGRELGVTIERDPRGLFARTKPDIAVVAVNSYMVDAVEQLRACAEYGVNVVTLSEEALFPWNTSPEITAELDQLAKSTGATITGTGHQDTYWVNIVAMMMGSCHTIEAVDGLVSWNVDDYGPEVVALQQVGTTPDQFHAWLASADRPPTFGRNVVDALVADVGLTPTNQTTRTRPDIAEVVVRSTSTGVEYAPGTVIGFTDVDQVETAEGITITYQMSGRVYTEAEHDVNEWSIKGEPDFVLSNGVVPTSISTVTHLVNRIPDVINAEPGFVTIEKLPRLRFRAFPLHTYVRH